jgi:hypothetical protein
MLYTFNFNKNLENDMFTFLHGTHPGYGGQPSDLGYTLILKRPKMHTRIFFEDFEEAKDTALNHVASYEEKCKLDKAEAEYCVANPWTYFGT